MEQEDLKKIYSRIAKDHPKVDLKPIHRVKLFVKEEASKKSKREAGVTKRDVVRGLNVTEREAARCLGYLVEGKYVEVSKSRARVFFFSSENYDGTFGERIFGKAISEFLKKKFRELIDFVRNKKLINAELQPDFEKVIETADSDSQNLEAFNKIVQFACWNKGYRDFVKLSFRSTANRYI